MGQRQWKKDKGPTALFTKEIAMPRPEACTKNTARLRATAFPASSAIR